MDMSADMMNGKAVSGLNASAVSDWVFDLDNRSIRPGPACLRVAERMTSSLWRILTWLKIRPLK